MGRESLSAFFIYFNYYLFFKTRTRKKLDIDFQSLIITKQVNMIQAIKDYTSCTGDYSVHVRLYTIFDCRCGFVD